MRTIAEIHLSDNDREAVEAAALTLRTRHPVEQVILFGSKARGTDDPESDIDLLVLTSRPLDWGERDRITDDLFDLQLERDVVISALVVSADEWEEGLYQALPIRAEIENEGAAA